MGQLNFQKSSGRQVPQGMDLVEAPAGRAPPGHPISDHDVYRHEISMADLADPLGLDSIWDFH
jgi:hypothetical protein